MAEDREGWRQSNLYTLKILVRVQIYTLDGYNSYTFGVQTCTIRLVKDVRLWTWIFKFASIKHICTLITSAGLHPEGFTQN